ncbi:MAG: ABC transporter permease [Spirochaetaceae bacterium]|jgi:ABC-type nitrate/sulfonate/bicarbonate transport system permease component|nr:ABC transporter permease [Spirochaetaceae bacterium]
MVGKRIKTFEAPRFLFLLLLLALWQTVSGLGLVPPYMLPSPLRIVRAMANDFPLLMRHTGVTMLETAVGLLLSLAASFVLALVMDNTAFLRRQIMPILLFTQTVPTIAVAPLLVLWLGYGASPKIALVFITCFFPLTVGLLSGLQSADEDSVQLLKSMGATRRHIYRYLKLPSSLPGFFSGLRIAGSYAVIAAVVAEWLGGNSGLGVYMTRVRKSYSFDKMFAVILLTAALSLVLMRGIEELEKRVVRWKPE